MMRRLIAVIAIVVVLGLAWTGGWYWAAGWADRNAGGVLKRIAERGVMVDCPDRHITGFPFALRVSCGTTAVAERHTGSTARLGGVSGGASVFAPTTATVAMTSPAHIESPLLEGPADIAWSDASVGVGMGLGGPRDVRFAASDLAARFVLRGLTDPSIAARRASGTLSPSDDGGTKASFDFTDLAVTSDGTTLPPATGKGSMKLSLPPRALLAGRAALRPPIAAHAIDVSLKSDGAHIMAKGDLEVDKDGVLNGKLTITIGGAESLPKLIALLPPGRQQLATTMAGAIFMVGRPATLDGEPASEISIDIDHGKAKIGLVEVKLPPVPI